MASIQPGTASEAEQKKRRACDECRTRKLACTKESDGCRRCKREAIACIYSAQKQMGRPRKRPRFHGEDMDMTGNSGIAGNASGSGINNDASPLTVDASTTPGITPTPNNNEGDVGLSMLAEQSSSPTGLSFFDFLGVGGDSTNNDDASGNLDPFLQQQTSSNTPSLSSMPAVAAMGPMPGLAIPPGEEPSSQQRQPGLITQLYPQSLFGVNFSNLDFSTSSLESLESGVPDLVIPNQAPAQAQAQAQTQIQIQSQHHHQQHHQHVSTSSNQHSNINTMNTLTTMSNMNGSNNNPANIVSPTPSLTASAVSQPSSSSSPPIVPNAASTSTSASGRSNLTQSMQSTGLGSLSGRHRFSLLPPSPKLSPLPDATSSHAQQQSLSSQQPQLQPQQRQPLPQAQPQTTPVRSALPPTIIPVPTASTADAYSKASAAWLLTAPNRVCGCLARLYLALDSLQHLPTEVGPAMSVARNAAHTAHDTILCPSCSPENIADINYRPPVQSYQNLMILGALLPSIAHTYRRIVTMVDEEAARASAAKVRLAISLTEYGGVWGHMARWDNVCAQTSTLDNSIVDPPLWRLVVRALLKMDVYGIHLDRADVDVENDTGSFKEGQLRTEGKNICFASNTSHAAEANSGAGPNSSKDGAQHFMVPVHYGLKDIVEMMEARARLRHVWMDAAYESGQIKATAGYCGYKPLPPGEKHNCEKIIEIAKREIDQLVIV